MIRVLGIYINCLYLLIFHNCMPQFKLKSYLELKILNIHLTTIVFNHLDICCLVKTCKPLKHSLNSFKPIRITCNIKILNSILTIYSYIRLVEQEHRRNIQELLALNALQHYILSIYRRVPMNC